MNRPALVSGALFFTTLKNNEMKKIGVVCEPAKEQIIKKELTAAGYTPSETIKRQNGCNVLVIKVKAGQIDQAAKEIGKVCKKLQIDFERSN